MKFRSLFLQFAFVCFAITAGCARTVDSTNVPGEQESSIPQETSPKDAAELNDAIDAQDASEVLSEATRNFTNVFSDSFEGEDDDSGLGVDASLVDEETRKKYTADRSLVAPTLARRDDATNAPRFRLEYKFPPRTDLAWSVTHLVRKRVSYGGKEKLIETSSTTKRRWEILDATDDGKVSARHWIDRMILRQDDHEKDPVDYDSERDVVVPKEIAAFGTEKAVGVVLETFKIDSRGVMSDKKKLVAEYNGREGDSNVMVPFPEEEIAVGDVWTTPYALYLKGSDETTRPYRVIERFCLESADERYATISFETTLVSIVDDPVVEGALAERLFTGRALFDRELGQTTQTELNFKRTVPNAYGFASFLEYDCQVVEKYERQEAAAEPKSTGEESDEATNVVPDVDRGDEGKAE